MVATPGHTRGHVVFVDAAAELLFAGDHVLPHITPSIGFEAVPGPLPLGDYMDSLRLVRELPDRRLLPAHGPVSPSVHPASTNCSTTTCGGWTRLARRSAPTVPRRSRWPSG